MKRASFPLFSIALGVSFLAGCSSESNDSGLIAGSYPAAFLLERVSGEPVDTLSRPGADPHEFELSPQQTARVHDARLVVTIGGLQPAVDDVTADLDTALDLHDAVDVLEGSDADHDDHDHGDEGHEEDSHDEGHEEDEHGHDHGAIDPHFWLDPTRMVDAAEAIAARLVALEPERAAAIEDNTSALVGALQTLDAEFEDGLASCKRDTFVTSHSAFAYLADRYDLDQVPISGLDSHNEPAPASMARIVTEIERAGVTTVFTERLAESSVADAVAAEAGVDVAVLDPIEGLTDQTADDDYFSLMRANLEALRTANDCS